MKHFEIEQKFRITAPNLIRRLLKKMRAKKVSSGAEYNEFYAHPKNKRKKALRLRHTGKNQGKLTFKGPRLKGKYAKRFEVETPVDYRGAKLILECLGFKKILAYTKKREDYRLGATIITLDHLPKFGWFVEIEGKSRSIDRLAKKLGLKNREEKSYFAMVYSRK